MGRCQSMVLSSLCAMSVLVIVADSKAYRFEQMENIDIELNKQNQHKSGLIPSWFRRELMPSEFPPQTNNDEELVDMPESSWSIYNENNKEVSNEDYNKIMSNYWNKLLEHLSNADEDYWTVQDSNDNPDESKELQYRGRSLWSNWLQSLEMKRQNKLLNISSCGVRLKTNESTVHFIVGGVEAKPNSWPWAVGVFRKDRYICGGTLINQRYVLTAAHCVAQRNGADPPANLYQILVGAHQLHKSGVLVPVQRVIVHQDYDDNEMQNDIALFRLIRPVYVEGKQNLVSPVCLPTPAMDEEHKFAGKLSTVVGWGYLREGGRVSSTLQEVEIPIISNKECAKAYGPSNIREGQICAAYPKGGRDSCQGDSGGSLTLPNSGHYFQLGIVSWGHGCARPKAPGVYTRVSKYIDWILQTVQP